MEHKTRSHNKRNLIFVLLVVVAVLVVIGILFFGQPERTVTSFCRVAKEQKIILIGDVNYEQRLEAYKKLEMVSPDEIKPDITTIRKGYEAIVQDPSSTLSTGFGISGAEDRRTDFINQNCSDF